MEALYVWRDCHSYSRQGHDYYLIRCSCDEILRGDCGTALQATDPAELRLQLTQNNEWTRTNPSLGVEDTLCFLVSDDSMETITVPAHFPFSSLWNASSPLRPLGRVVLRHVNAVRSINEHMFSSAVTKYAEVRASFSRLHEVKLVSGNDNHIGDIGEHYVLHHIRKSDPNARLAPKKNALFDIICSNGTRISVKTLTDWASRGRGAQIKTDVQEWDMLYALHLNQELRPWKVAAIPYDELIAKPDFQRNRQRRSNGTRSFPAFRWWPWLDNYLIVLENQDRS